MKYIDEYGCVWKRMSNPNYVIRYYDKNVAGWFDGKGLRLLTTKY